MRALTLYQPWASAIALGLKRIETRPWETRYRGTLLIHAAKRPMVRGELPPTAHQQLAKAAGDGAALPFGAVVAIARLSNVVPTSRSGGVPVDELMWGDYRAGRFAWFLSDVGALPEPIEASGARGLWKPSEALLERLGAVGLVLA